jgi:uncharacterized delta-60 repeat protein
MGSTSGRATIVAAAIVAMAMALVAVPVIAAKGPGTLDQNFGDRGFASTQISSTGSGANRVVIAPDGSIVAAGVAFSGLGEDTDSDFALIGYTAAGEVDRGFGDSGSTVFDFGQTYVWETPNDLALTADGHILIAGSSVDEKNELAAGIARLDADGILDPTFAGDGTLVAAPEGLADANSVLPLPDGDFYVVGPERNGKAVVVARLNADGSLDPAFAGDGAASVDLGARMLVGHAVLTPAGEIVVITENGLVRIGATGDPDPSFGGPAPVDELYELAQAPNGDLYAASEDAVVRFGADGQLDESFAVDGVFEFSGASAFNAAGLALGSKGQVVVSGASKRGRDPRFTVAMLKRTGKLSRPFGDRGFAAVKRGTKALGVTVQPDGKIVAVGRTSGRSIFIGEVGGRDTKFAIARLLTR